MTRIAAVLGVALLGWLAHPVGAQGPRAGARVYDPHTVETVSGKVASIEHVPAANGRQGGVHIELEHDGGTIAVRLGPAWYVDAQKVHVAKGDQVEVEGSRVSVGGKQVVIARQVKKDGETLVLRDAAGVPAWAGHGGGRRGGR